MEMRRMYSTLTVVGVFAIAMGFLEAIVVVYLRELYYPRGFAFPLSTIPIKIFVTEFVREITTIVMLVCIATGIGKNHLQRFAYFVYTFGVWDIFYYIALKLFLNWPDSFFTWDVLFLIPVIWIGPVGAPILCAVTMIFLAVCIILFQERGYIVHIKGVEWGLLVVGSLLLFWSFIADYSMLLFRGGYGTRMLTIMNDEQFIKQITEYIPARYNWFLFGLGELCILGSIGSIIWKTRRKTGNAHG